MNMTLITKSSMLCVFPVFFRENELEADISIMIFLISRSNCGRWVVPFLRLFELFNKTLVKDLPRGLAIH